MGRIYPGKPPRESLTSKRRELNLTISTTTWRTRSAPNATRRVARRSHFVQRRSMTGIREPVAYIARYDESIIFVNERWLCGMGRSASRRDEYGRLRCEGP